MTTDLDKLAAQAAFEYKNLKAEEAIQFCYPIFHLVKDDPERLKHVQDYAIFGKAFLIMIDQNINEDIDDQQIMTNLGYLFLTKSIISKQSGFNAAYDRIFLLILGIEPFKYTVLNSFKEFQGLDPHTMEGLLAFSQSKREILKMLISEFEQYPILYQTNNNLMQYKLELDDKIGDDFFGSKETLDSLITKGIANHETITQFLEDKVFNEKTLYF